MRTITKVTVQDLLKVTVTYKNTMETTGVSVESLQNWKVKGSIPRRALAEIIVLLEQKEINFYKSTDIDWENYDGK